MIEPALAAALNHLLDREPWARERLQPFVGDVLEVRAAPLPTLRLAIAENTRIEAATPSLSATLVLTLKPGFAAALMQSEAQQMRTVDIAGNAQLASTLLYLARHLRWDVEEDLSKIVGDMAAHRMVNTARALFDWHRQTAQRFIQDSTDWVVEEKRWIISRQEFSRFASEVTQLRDAVARLEARLARHT